MIAIRDDPLRYQDARCTTGVSTPELLYGFQYRWAAGLRYEYAGGSGRSIGGRQNDPFRADRQRVSPLLVWNPSEFSRIRLQYNYDHANNFRDNNDAHALWLGFEFMYGAAPGASVLK